MSPCAMCMWFAIDSSLTLNRLRVIESRFVNLKTDVRDMVQYRQKVPSAWLNSRSKIMRLTPAQGRLSYGMAKNPVDYLAAVQRWAEGGVVLSLQTFFSCHKGALLSNVGPAGSGEDPVFVHLLFALFVMSFNVEAIISRCLMLFFPMIHDGICITCWYIIECVRYVCMHVSICFHMYYISFI